MILYIVRMLYRQRTAVQYPQSEKLMNGPWIYASQVDVNGRADGRIPPYSGTYERGRFRIVLYCK